MIRKATANDINQIQNLLNQILRVHHMARPDIFKEEGSKYSDEELKQIILDQNKPIFIYEKDEIILGHCFCSVGIRPETGATKEYKNLFIDDLCIDENARGLNIGRELYEYVKAYAKENDCYNITLDVWEGNEGAIAFYKKLGFHAQKYIMEEIL